MQGLGFMFEGARFGVWGEKRVRIGVGGVSKMRVIKGLKALQA